MALHSQFPTSPYAPLIPEQRWFPADETMRSTAYEKLLTPLVAKVRKEVQTWRDKGYPGSSATSVALLRHWFDTEHLTENADASLSMFRYYFAQREAVETVIWLHEIRKARDKYDLLRFDASGAVSSGMFDEDWPRYVLKMATGAGKTKVLSRKTAAWPCRWTSPPPHAATAAPFSFKPFPTTPSSGPSTRTSSNIRNWAKGGYKLYIPFPSPPSAVHNRCFAPIPRVSSA